MLAVFRVSVRRAVWRGARLHPRRVPAAGCAGSAPGSGAAAESDPGPGAAAGRGLSRQLISRHGTAIRGCTVDPNLEEQFVFVDCTGETRRPGQVQVLSEVHVARQKYCTSTIQSFVTLLFSFSCVTPARDY